MGNIERLHVCTECGECGIVAFVCAGDSDESHILRASVEFVPATQLRGAVEALRDIERAATDRAEKGIYDAALGVEWVRDRARRGLADSWTCPACRASASGLCSWHRDYGPDSLSPSQRARTPQPNQPKLALPTEEDP